MDGMGSYWTSATTWRDPDCIECDGEGAPCCDMPDHPPPGVRAWLRWHFGGLIPRVSYWLRPYDFVADRRRWFWQAPHRCGWYS